MDKYDGWEKLREQRTRNRARAPAFAMALTCASVKPYVLANLNNLPTSHNGIPGLSPNRKLSHVGTTFRARRAG